MRQLLWPAWLGMALLAALALDAVRLWHVVPAASFDAVATATRARWREGDLVVVTPPYIVAPRQRLGDLPLLERRALAARDLVDVRRVHLVEVDAVGARADAAQSLAALGVAAERTRFDGVTLTTYELRAPRRATYDLWRDLEQARVSVRYPGGAFEPCATWRRDRFVCRKEPQWSYVGRELRAFANVPERCVWMHPVERGGALAIEVGELSGTATLEYGFIDAVLATARGTVTLRLRAGERELWRATRGVAPGLATSEVALPEGAGPLTLELTADDNGAAHFCGRLRTIVEEGP